MKPNITVTDSAYTYIQKMLETNQGSHFRLSIKKTGCSGYSYLPSLAEKNNPDDLVIEVRNNFKLNLDPAWVNLMEGLIIDYLEEEKSGLKQKRLVFSNPNEKSRCGCGESFHA